MAKHYCQISSENLLVDQDNIAQLISLFHTDPSLARYGQEKRIGELTAAPTKEKFIEALSFDVKLQLRLKKNTVKMILSTCHCIFIVIESSFLTFVANGWLISPR